jgi:predicted RNase H-like nuclease
MRVIGIDACKAGWVGICLNDAEVTAYFAAHIADVVRAAGPLETVAVDIPIGLANRGRRQADVLARKELRGRSSTLFITPVRDSLAAADYATANQINRELADEGISRQAFALAPKVLQVDGWVGSAGVRVAEVHPELSFAELAGEPLRSPKKTWSGAVRRRELLAAAGIDVPADLGAAGRMAAVDDVLDAAAAAWTARRITLGTARSLPDPPELFTDGNPAAIWV